jgi:hypothetical protein
MPDTGSFGKDFLEQIAHWWFLTAAPLDPFWASWSRKRRAIKNLRISIESGSLSQGGKLDPDDAAAPHDRYGSDDLYRMNMTPLPHAEKAKIVHPVVLRAIAAAKKKTVTINSHQWKWLLEIGRLFRL